MNAPQSEGELAALRRSLKRGSPFGDAGWTDTMTRRLNLESTLPTLGRPTKARQQTVADDVGQLAIEAFRLAKDPGLEHEHFADQLRVIDQA